MAPPTAAEKAATEAEHLRLVTYHVSLKDTSIVFDWAGLVEVSSLEDPLSGGIRGLRAFALPKGFATHSGVRGHYFINS
eukprot:2124206-Pleurochrysis_carterae.AAC.1